MIAIKISRQALAFLCTVANEGRFNSEIAQLLSVDEFAAALGVRPATVRQWVWMREIPYLKVGRCVRFKRETLDRLIQRSEVPALEHKRA